MREYFEIEGTEIDLFYRSWGAAELPTLICVHGLTRNSLDFEYIGKALQNSFNVIAPDIPGRGESGYLINTELYNNAFYSKIMLKFLEIKAIKNCCWLGTSMGGIIGMIMAATAPKTVSKLVLNDIGALIPRAALQRLKEYVGKEVSFPDMKTADEKLRSIFSPFGLSDETHWQHLINSSLRQIHPEKFIMRYDAKIAEPFKNASDEDVSLWPIFNNITCPILLLRGANSDLLLKETATKMLEKQNVELVEFACVGHAPALYSSEQIAIVENFLCRS